MNAELFRLTMAAAKAEAAARAAHGALCLAEDAAAYQPSPRRARRVDRARALADAAARVAEDAYAALCLASPRAAACPHGTGGYRSPARLVTRRSTASRAAIRRAHSWLHRTRAGRAARAVWQTRRYLCGCAVDRYQPPAICQAHQPSPGPGPCGRPAGLVTRARRPA